MEKALNGARSFYKWRARFRGRHGKYQRCMLRLIDYLFIGFKKRSDRVWGRNKGVNLFCFLGGKNWEAHRIVQQQQWMIQYQSSTSSLVAKTQQQLARGEISNITQGTFARSLFCFVSSTFPFRTQFESL